MSSTRHPHTHTPAPPGPFEYRFTPTVSSIRLARHVLAGWLELQPGADRTAVEDLLVVCSELVTNAVRHAAATAEATIALRASTDPDPDTGGILLEVEDTGTGFPWPTDRAFADVGVADEHGRGLLIVQALTDDLAVVTTDDARTVVRCRKHHVLDPHQHGQGHDDASGRTTGEPAAPQHQHQHQRAAANADQH